MGARPNAALPLDQPDGAAEAPALVVEGELVAEVVVGGPCCRGGGAQRRHQLLLVGRARALERVLDQPHVAVGADRVLVEPRLAAALGERGEDLLLRLRGPVGRHDDQPLQGLGAHRLEHLRARQLHPDGDRRQAPLAETELAHLAQHQLRVGKLQRVVEQEVGPGRAQLLHHRGRVGERRGVDLVDDDADAEPLKAAFPERLHERLRGRGAVGDDCDLRGLLAGRLLRHLEHGRDRVAGKDAGDGNGLDDVLEAAVGDLVGVGERDPRQAGTLGHLGDRQRQRGAPGAGAGHDIGLVGHEPLGGVLRRLHGVAGILDDEPHLRAMEGLDAALGVDVLDRELGAELHQLAGARHGARDRRNERHLDLRLLGRDAWRETRPGQQSAGRQQAKYPAAILLAHMQLSFLIGVPRSHAL
jgi:hypothetical protein